MFRELHEITISHTKNIVNTPSSIDDDLLLFDKFEDVPLPTEPKRMQCLFVALCIDGQAQYTVDTNEYKVVKGDLIIITDGPFKDSKAIVKDINEEKQQVTVTVSMFGRETPVTLDFIKVRKV